MGADLYIEKIHHPLMQKYEPLFEAAVRRRDSFPSQSKEAEAAQREVTKYYDLMYSEGYFRDSYNATSVLWRLGLSWWEDVTPLCTKKRKLRHDKLRKFRDMVANANLELPSKEEIENHSGKVDEEGENSLAEWHKYFIEKQNELLAFLDKAIELKSPIHCSL
jgi:hypothetical protein